MFYTPGLAKCGGIGSLCWFKSPKAHVVPAVGDVVL